MACASKKSPLMTKSNFSRAAIFVGSISVVSHLPLPSGSGPPGATCRCNCGFVRSISATYKRVGGFVRVSEWMKMPGNGSFVTEISALAAKKNFSSATKNSAGKASFMCASSNNSGFFQSCKSRFARFRPGRRNEFFDDGRNRTFPHNRAHHDGRTGWNQWNQFQPRPDHARDATRHQGHAASGFHRRDQAGHAVMLLHDLRLATHGLKQGGHFIVIFGIIFLGVALSLIHISEPTRRTPISYAVFCLK